ncbi:Gmad2 immunoglobulin-like domain-containing protein [Nocardioides litoris]|uniref:Gmad2 immunoglobulin-like domain-containing protein n=1 Tax=Nocardioides litoris TaxID=1926648 RepID=UPI001121F3D2|nr:Gmad2 immunoglobulin-like domain-containing protein [Nocardioides litoris]
MRTPTRLAALALAGLLSTGLAACGDDTEPSSSPTAADPAPTEESSAPTDGGDSSQEPGTTEPGGEAEGGTAVPVYFVGETPLGQRLYREFHRVDGDPLLGAAQVLVEGAAEDPDYTTLLPGVTVEAVEQRDGAIVVTLGEDSPLSADKGTSSEQAALAVQSLVYTLQGAAGSREPVRVELADGSPADLYDQPTGEGVEAQPQLDVLSLVSLTTPTEGEQASGTLAVEGVASSFEATVPLAVLDEAGTEVLTDFTTAEAFGDQLYPFATELDVSGLEPGTYTLVARTDDPSGGEGPGPFEDTRTFTVG